MNEYKKEQKLMEAITELPDSMIEEAHPKKKPLIRFSHLISAAAVCLIIILAGKVFLSSEDLAQSAAPRSLVKLSQPKGYPFDDHKTRMKIRDKNPVSDEFFASVDAFSYETASNLLSTSNKNINYSPLSLYYALSMAASGAGGTTQKELLSLLHISDLETLSTQCANFYRRFYLDNEIGIQKLSNSIWMDDSVDWNEDYVKRLAEYFYAASFSLDLSDPDTAGDIGAWISDQTNGLFSPTVQLSPETILSLDIQGTVISALQVDLRRYDPNQKIWVSLDPRRINVFNKATQRLIRYAEAREKTEDRD